MFEDTEERIQRLVRGAERKFKSAFAQMVRDARQDLSLSSIQDLLDTGRFGQVFRVLEDRIRIFSMIWTDRFMLAANRTTALIRRETGRAGVVFDQASESAVLAMRDAQLRMMTEFLRTQRKVARESLVTGAGRGLEPASRARAFRDSIGLTSAQARAVQNFRAALESGRPSDALRRKLRDRRFDRTVRRGNLTPAQIDRMVDRFREKLLKARGDVIARTEARRATNKGVNEAYGQAQAIGAIERGSVTQTWITSADEKVRGSHASMHGQIRPEGVPFISGLGNQLQFPGDENAPVEDVANCRCILKITVGAGIPSPVIDG